MNCSRIYILAVTPTVKLIVCICCSCYDNITVTINLTNANITHSVIIRHKYTIIFEIRIAPKTRSIAAPTCIVMINVNKIARHIKIG